VAYQTQLN